jgi:glycosyltransferase involved in cell wall biosynthesis
VRARVVTARASGPREAEVRAAGLPFDCAHGDEAALAGLLRGADVVHVFRSGGREPLVPAAAKAAGVPVLVETNIFGQVDPTADEAAFAMHLFISKMCALRYRRRLGLDGPEFHARHRVLPLPVDVERLVALAPSREEAKRRLGLDPARPVVGRLGRADDLKWRRLLVSMLPRLLERVPETQVLYVGTTPAKLRDLDRLGLLDQVRIPPPVLDPEQLATYYRACDVLVGAASIGESGGVAMAEAMALGIPVVTCSTPWVDNGQIELVEHGVDGLVANHPAPFADAVAELLRDDALRERLGTAAARKIAERYALAPLTRQLEELYRALLAGEAPRAWLPSDAEVDAFAGDYDERLTRSTRPLTDGEERDARRERRREQRGRATGALRRIDREKAALALSMARAKLPV